MTTSRLNDDCILYILKFLQNDRSTLFKCLMANRFLSKITIPLLYANPFERLKDDKKHLIIKTFLSCLNEDETSYLLKLNDDYKIPNLNDLIISDVRPIFEYPKFIKQLLTSEIQSAIGQWTNKYIEKKSILIYDLLQSLTQVCYHMFLRQGVHLNHLEIYPSIFKTELFDHLIIPNLFTLSTLTLSTCDDDTSEFKRGNISDFLTVIAKNCKSINQLNLKQPEVYNSIELSTIIKRQKELKEFIFTHSENLFKNIFSSLEFQKHSLVTLKFRYVNFHEFILQSMINLYNLKSLEINSCHGMTLELCKIFHLASFKLKELIILGNNWETSITITIIKYLGITLQQLRIIKITLELMEIISQYCLNLVTLYISLEYNINPSIFPYFKNLKIKNLNIMPQYISSEDGELKTLDLDKLATNFSKDVIKVSLFSCQFMKKEILSSFLNNCPNHIITLNLRKKLDTEYLEIILNYIKKKNNNLKFLGFFGLDKILSNEELKMINQIKEKGIKLVEFNEIL
ncbi:11581_t:CDS:1 [Funneliformis caledonium]|uniref:11581_t:CDS:1 n=1 Tax=Funneliformis caledonium TaxID=1117310 RepID=A0A9N8ZBH7_9GLOM|nr:11581_t:CDS:1 [Funneliformis caledonium]